MRGQDRNVMDNKIVYVVSDSVGEKAADLVVRASNGAIPIAPDIRRVPLLVEDTGTLKKK